MDLFISTLGRMAFLFSFILLGYIVAKTKAVPENAETVLSRLESTIFIPALIIGSFMRDFTVDKLSIAWRIVLTSFILTFITMALSVPTSKLFSKDDFTRKICTYGLAFANIGFMGNAVVEAVFPDIFFEYVLFTVPINTMIYLWGVPVLLVPTGGKGIRERLKSFANPMFASIVIGIFLGLSGLGAFIPKWGNDAINAVGSCMSPCAMLLTGMTVSRINLRETFTRLNIYALSFVRLIAIPLCYIGVMLLLPLDIPETVFICGLCAVSMPPGLNMVVIPGAYGKDTRIAAGMAIVSHLLSCITIPIIFTIALAL